MKNPFPKGDPDRCEIWEMLVKRDIEAFLAADWSMVEGDFIRDGFFGLHGHGLRNPDSWKLDFPDLDTYRDEWLRQAKKSQETEYGEPLGEALCRVTTLRDIDMGKGVAVVRKKFDGFIQLANSGTEKLNWQTLYFCANRGRGWKIASFVGYLPFPMA